LRKKELSFEDALAALEDIVDSLENEQFSLSESLAYFEKGIGLSKMCLAKLEEAEKKIEILCEQDGKLSIQPFSLEMKGE